MSIQIPTVFLDAFSLAHPSWRPVLLAGLEAVAQADPAYLPVLAADAYLPTGGRIFAAFVLPLEEVRYVLVGEGPYPREESATGVCFMDGAVNALWSEKGLSKQVNRATSLRNFMKMLLVAEGVLSVENTRGDAIAHATWRARSSDSTFIRTRADLQVNLLRQGFLLLNAALVYRSHVPPLKEAKAWQPFLQKILLALMEQVGGNSRQLPTWVLWGKIAEQLYALPLLSCFPKAVAEHPYNLSFIANSTMQALFAPMHLLHR